MHWVFDGLLLILFVGYNKQVFKFWMVTIFKFGCYKVFIWAVSSMEGYKFKHGWSFQCIMMFSHFKYVSMDVSMHRDVFSTSNTLAWTFHCMKIFFLLQNTRAWIVSKNEDIFSSNTFAWLLQSFDNFTYSKLGLFFTFNGLFYDCLSLFFTFYTSINKYHMD